MGNLDHNPNYELRPDAAAAFNAAQAKYGAFKVNSAKRTAQQQQVLIDRYHKGGAINRPPYLYKPAEPAGASNHVKNGGIAVDLADWRRFATIAAEFGFSHPYAYDLVHFEFVGVPKAVQAAGGPVSSATLQQQQWLNSRGWSLVEDGRPGPKTKQAIKEYQQQLKNMGLYTGKIDGIWGGGTQAAHAVFYARVTAAPPAPTPAQAAPKAHIATVADLKGIGDVRGLQKVAKKNGYTGRIDNDFGGGSQAGLQTFLNRNYSGSLAKWLRTKWGYADRDDLWGPNMRAAALRASAANFKAL